MHLHKRYLKGMAGRAKIGESRHQSVGNARSVLGVSNRRILTGRAQCCRRKSQLKHVEVRMETPVDGAEGGAHLVEYPQHALMASGASVAYFDAGATVCRACLLPYSSDV